MTTAASSKHEGLDWDFRIDKIRSLSLIFILYHSLPLLQDPSSPAKDSKIQREREAKEQQTGI